MRTLLQIHLPLGALACIIPAHGEVIYSDLQNLDIPKTNDGIYLNVLTGNTSGSPFAGWHINPTFGGINVYNSADFQPLRETASATGMLSHFDAGGLIEPSSDFFSSGFGVSGDHLGINGTFTAGTEGFMGFSVVDGINTHYGWMRVVFTGTGTPLIRDWAYHTGGGSIAAGNVIQAGSTYTLDSSAQSFTLASAFTGSHEVIVKGGNTVALSSAHSFTGSTTIQSGTLALNASASIKDSSLISVGSGSIFDVSASVDPWELGASQTLSGTGTVVGDATISGTHAPGNSPGLQQMNGDVIYSSTSILNWDFAANIDTAGGGIGGTDYDAVSVTGDLTIQSGATFRMIQNLGLSFSDTYWQSDRQWTDLFQVTGNVTGWAADTPVAVFDLNNDPVNIADYGSLTLNGTTLTWTAIPEPINGLLGLLIAASLFPRRRNQR